MNVLHGKISWFLLVRELSFSGASKKWRLQLRLPLPPCLWLLRSRVALAHRHVRIARTSWWKVAHSASVPSCEWTIGPAHGMASQCRSFLGEFCQDIPLLVIVLFGRRLTYKICVYIYKNLERNSVCSMPGRRNRGICLASTREALRAWSINKPSHQGSTRLLGTSSIRPPSRSTVAMPGRFTLWNGGQHHTTYWHRKTNRGSKTRAYPPVLHI